MRCPDIELLENPRDVPSPAHAHAHVAASSLALPVVTLVGTTTTTPRARAAARATRAESLDPRSRLRFVGRSDRGSWATPPALLTPPPPLPLTNGKNGASSSSGATGGGDESPPLPSYLLKLSPQPPENPFVNVYFQVKVFLVDRKDRMKVGVQTPLYIELLYESGDVVVLDQNILEMSGAPTPCSIPTSGQLTLSMRMKELSMGHGNQKFRLRFSCADKTPLGPIEPVLSIPIHVVRHRLLLHRQPPNVWFKDEGGRDKCIEVTGVLIDENEKPVRNREIPLTAKLVYDNENAQEVKDQSILKINPGLNPRVDANGAVNLRFRIEEVSKNHQKQAFRIKISPDTSISPANCDISNVISDAIMVRSKRNRRRTRQNFQSSLQSYAPAPQRQNTGGGLPMMKYGSPPSPMTNIPQAQVKKSTVPLPMSNGTPAMSVTRWARYANECLSNLEWVLAGYGLNANGDTDISKPIHKCPYCHRFQDCVLQNPHSEHCMLHQALTTFSQSVNPKLGLLSSSQSVIPTTTHPYTGGIVGSTSTSSIARGLTTNLDTQIVTPSLVSASASLAGVGQQVPPMGVAVPAGVQSLSTSMSMSTSMPMTTSQQSPASGTTTRHQLMMASAPLGGGGGGSGGPSLSTSSSLVSAPLASLVQPPDSGDSGGVASSMTSAGTVDVIPSFSQASVAVKAENDVIMGDNGSMASIAVQGPASSTTGMLAFPPLSRQTSLQPLGAAAGGGGGSALAGVGGGGSSSAAPYFSMQMPPMQMPALGGVGGALARDPSLYNKASFMNDGFQTQLPPMAMEGAGGGLSWQPSILFDQNMVTGGAPLSSDMSSYPCEFEVVAIMCTRTNDGQPGFPAFDAQDQCVGFYVQDDHSSRLRFVPIEESAMKGQEDILVAEYMDLKKNPQGGDMGNESPLITKEDFVVLERMKEQALLRHYQFVSGSS